MRPTFVGCALSVWVSTLLVATSRAQDCGTSPAAGYVLDTVWQGHNFSDGWAFEDTYPDPTNGPTLYVNKSTALAEGLMTTGIDWATIRPGSVTTKVVNGSSRTLRKSIRLESSRAWTHFLLVLKYNQLPASCGAWPAFWTTCASKQCPTWPAGGEIDILEYCDRNQNTKSSVHIGGNNTCSLSGAAIDRCGHFTDMNGMGNNCFTNYSQGKLGCAPNNWSPSPTKLAEAPGTIAMEWSEDFIKVFHFGEHDVPVGLAGDKPTPSLWGEGLVAYYPFAASEETCPSYKNMLGPQNVIINLAVCGDWAGNYGWWSDTPCLAEGVLAGGGLHPTCDKYIVSDLATKNLARNANFNMSYVKVFTPKS